MVFNLAQAECKYVLPSSRISDQFTDQRVINPKKVKGLILLMIGQARALNITLRDEITVG